MSYYVRVSVTCVLLIMHNYHVIYVLIYYSGIRVKNLNSGLKNTLCIIIITVYYGHVLILCIIVYCVLLLSIITVKICLR